MGASAVVVFCPIPLGILPEYIDRATSHLGPALKEIGNSGHDRVAVR